MNRRRFLATSTFVVGAVVAQAGLMQPAVAAGQRFAAPTGSGTACTSAAPCALDTAVNGATSFTEVIVASGTYNVGSTNLTQPSTVTNVNVHGVTGQPSPVINTTANIGLQLLGTGARVADLTIVQNGSQWGLNVFAANIVVERVTVRTNAQVACGLGYSGTARDLLCVTSADNGTALDDTWGGGIGRLNVRNLTAVATGAGSYGINAEATGINTDLDISAKNTIAMGTKADIRASELPVNDTTSESDVNLTNSNYDLREEAGGGNVSDVGTVSTNQTVLPVFADTVAYHQAPSSPTVDKGASDSLVGTTDLDGQPRKFGVAVDIGADEFVPDTTPPDVALDHTPKHRTHKHKGSFTFHASEPATFMCFVDKHAPVACSSPFKAKFKKSGKHTLTVSATDSAGNVDPTPATYTWKVKKKKRHKHRPHHGHH